MIMRIKITYTDYPYFPKATEVSKSYSVLAAILILGSIIGAFVLIAEFEWWGALAALVLFVVCFFVIKYLADERDRQIYEIIYGKFVPKPPQEIEGCSASRMFSQINYSQLVGSQKEIRESRKILLLDREGEEIKRIAKEKGFTVEQLIKISKNRVEMYENYRALKKQKQINR